MDGCQVRCGRGTSPNDAVRQSHPAWRDRGQTEIAHVRRHLFRFNRDGVGGRATRRATPGE